MPAMPKGKGVREGILKGLYRYKKGPAKKAHTVQIFASAVTINAALEAQSILSKRHGVSADIWSATSYQLLRRDALQCERWNRLHPEDEPREAYIDRILDGVEGPFIAVSDYMKMVPEQIARWVPGTFAVLGTDGFGMSDTREMLRRHFEIDAASIVIATLDALFEEEAVEASVVAQAIKDLGYDTEKRDPLDV